MNQRATGSFFTKKLGNRTARPLVLWSPKIVHHILERAIVDIRTIPLSTARRKKTSPSTGKAVKSFPR